MSNLIYPLVATLINAGDVVFEKKVFDGKKEKYYSLIPVLFLFACVILIVFMFPFLDHSIKDGAWKFWPMVLLVLIIVMCSIRHDLYYKSLRKVGLTSIEPFVAFTPLLTILIAGAIYPDERNFTHFALAIIASLALIISHVKRKHLVIDKKLLPILAVVVLEAVEVSIIKELLHFYSPVAMYTMRTALVALFLFVYYRPSVNDISKKDMKNASMISAMWVIMMILIYYSYQQVGVVYTSLITMLSPLLVVVGSWFFLKERKIQKRNIIALVIVLVCVALAQIIG